jgi:hypothetical protein
MPRPSEVASEPGISLRYVRKARRSTIGIFHNSNRVVTLQMQGVSRELKFPRNEASAYYCSGILTENFHGQRVSPVSCDDR